MMVILCILYVVFVATVYSSLVHAEVSQKYPLACTGFTVHSGLVASGFALLWIY